VFAVISGGQGDGKTVVVANTGLAAARLGVKVLLIDADFGDQRLTELLSGSRDTDRGITEVVEQGVPLRGAVQRVGLTGGASIDMLSRGKTAVSAPDFFRTQAVQEVFDTLGGEYDLVLVDVPPLLHVAYASAILSYSDSPIVVVSRGGSVSSLEELAGRLTFLETDPIGYVYNRAPLRDDRAHGQGSMKDVLGRADTERH